MPVFAGELQEMAVKKGSLRAENKASLLDRFTLLLTYRSSAYLPLLGNGLDFAELKYRGLSCSPIRKD
jgi:hypothetical protein